MSVPVCAGDLLETCGAIYINLFWLIGWSVVNIARPFRDKSRHYRNQLPDSFHHFHPSRPSDWAPYARVSSSSCLSSPLSPSITPSLFQSRLKKYLFNRRLLIPSVCLRRLLNCFPDFSHTYWFVLLLVNVLFRSVQYSLSWPPAVCFWRRVNLYRIVSYGPRVCATRNPKFTDPLH